MRLLAVFLFLFSSTVHSGKWVQQVIDDTPGKYSFGILAVDLDGDGDLDLVVPEITQPISPTPDGNGGFACQGQNQGSALYWFENLGRKQFAKRHIDSGQPGWYERLHAADLNGDGKKDIVAGDNTGKDLIIYFNNRTSWTRHRQGTSTNRLYEIKSGDFNGDGKLDLVVGGYASNDLTIFTNPGEVGTVWPANRIGTLLSEVRSVEVFDVDGNGKLDILVMARTGNEISIFFGNPNGTFTKRVVGTSTTPIHGRFAQIVASGNVEIVAAHGNDEVAYYQTFDFLSWSRTVVGTVTGAFDVDAADLDGDGDVDIAVVAHVHPQVGATPTSGGNALVWFENAGGSWRQHFIGAAIAANQVHIADMDGDGRKDILTIQDTGNGCPRQAGGSRASVWYQQP